MHALCTMDSKSGCEALHISREIRKLNLNVNRCELASGAVTCCTESHCAQKCMEFLFDVCT